MRSFVGGLRRSGTLGSVMCQVLTELKALLYKLGILCLKFYAEVALKRDGKALFKVANSVGAECVLRPPSCSSMSRELTPPDW